MRWVNGGNDTASTPTSIFLLRLPHASRSAMKPAVNPTGVRADVTALVMVPARRRTSAKRHSCRAARGLLVDRWTPMLSFPRGGKTRLDFLPGPCECPDPGIKRDFQSPALRACHPCFRSRPRNHYLQPDTSLAFRFPLRPRTRVWSVTLPTAAPRFSYQGVESVGACPRVRRVWKVAERTQSG